MQPVNALTASPLQWVKPSWRKYDYELRDGPVVVATLSINGWMNRATGATSTGTYHFQRVGFWKGRIAVSDGDSDTPLAAYAPHWTGNRGELTLANGTIFQRTQRGFWHQTTEWTDAEGQWMVRAAANWRSQMLVTLNATVPTRPETGMLLLLTQYLTAVAAMEASSVAATTVATS